MADLLHKLENNEAILLMYAADELDAEDRMEVEQLLATDARLREELRQLVEIHEQTRQELSELDEDVHLPTGAALTRVNRTIKQWQADRARQEFVEPAPNAKLRYPWWTYPAAAVAASVLAGLVWFGHSSGDMNIEFGPSDQARQWVERSQTMAAMQLAYSFDGIASSNLQSINEMESDMNNIPMETAWEF